MGNRRSSVSSTTALLTLLTSLLFGIAAPGAGALTLFKFVGTVRDADGRPLVGATVSDGSQSTATDASGRYTLNESSTGSFVVYAYRSDTNVASQSRNVVVPLDQTIDFILLYNISASVSPSALSVAHNSATVTVSVTSYAPNPGTAGGAAGTSCVSVTDSRRGTTLAAASSGGSPTGPWSWTVSFSVAEHSAEGLFIVSVVASDCATGTVLTNSNASPPSYRIDNTAPQVTALEPADGGNTIFASQPIVVYALDPGGSGVSTAGSSITVEDSTTGSSTTFNGSILNVSSIAGGGRASAISPSSVYSIRTPNMNLHQGDVYRITATVADSVGNSRTTSQMQDSSGGFLSTSFTATTTNAVIPPTACVLSSGTSPATKTATCNHVPLQLSAAGVSIGGLRQAPVTGYIEQTSSLQSATISTLGLPGLPAYNSNDPAWSPKRIPQRFEVTSTLAQSLVVPNYTADIGTLTTQVPAAWSSASLQMGSTGTTVSHDACADGGASTLPCSPDPFANRYLVVLTTGAGDPGTVAASQLALTSSTVRTTYSPDSYAATMPYPVAKSLQLTAPTSMIALSDQPAISYSIRFDAALAGGIASVYTTPVDRTIEGRRVLKTQEIATDGTVTFALPAVEALPAATNRTLAVAATKGIAGSTDVDGYTSAISTDGLRTGGAAVVTAGVTTRRTASTEALLERALLGMHSDFNPFAVIHTEVPVYDNTSSPPDYQVIVSRVHSTNPPDLCLVCPGVPCPCLNTRVSYGRQQDTTVGDASPSHWILRYEQAWDGNSKDGWMRDVTKMTLVEDSSNTSFRATVHAAMFVKKDPRNESADDWHDGQSSHTDVISDNAFTTSSPKLHVGAHCNPDPLDGTVGCRNYAWFIGGHAYYFDAAAPDPTDVCSNDDWDDPTLNCSDYQFDSP